MGRTIGTTSKRRATTTTTKRAKVTQIYDDSGDDDIRNNNSSGEEGLSANTNTNDDTASLMDAVDHLHKLVSRRKRARDDTIYELRKQVAELTSQAKAEQTRAEVAHQRITELEYKHAKYKKCVEDFRAMVFEPLSCRMCFEKIATSQCLPCAHVDMCAACKDALPPMVRSEPQCLVCNRERVQRVPVVLPQLLTAHVDTRTSMFRRFSMRSEADLEASKADDERYERMRRWAREAVEDGSANDNFGTVTAQMATADALAATNPVATTTTTINELSFVSYDSEQEE